jgi:hypothetical protein
MKRATWMFVLTALMIASCKKEEPKPKDPEPTPVTYKLNSKLDGVNFSSNPVVTLESGVLYIEAENAKSPNNFMQIMLDFAEIVEGNSYRMGDLSELAFNPSLYAYGTYISSAADYFTTDETNVESDKVTITKFDVDNKKISGTFKFKVYGSGGTFKSFEDGTFTDLTW